MDDAHSHQGSWKRDLTCSLPRRGGFFTVPPPSTGGAPPHPALSHSGCVAILKNAEIMSFPRKRESRTHGKDRIPHRAALVRNDNIGIATPSRSGEREMDGVRCSHYTVAECFSKVDEARAEVNETNGATGLLQRRTLRGLARIFHRFRESGSHFPAPISHGMTARGWGRSG